MDYEEVVALRADLLRFRQIQRERHIQMAGTNGVELTAVYPELGGFNYRYTPANEDWPLLELHRMLTNWRISEVEIPGLLYARHWCYPGIDSYSFMRAVSAIAVWQGNPRIEPSGWIKSWDGRRDGIARPPAPKASRRPLGTSS